jgi:hypothetical protein
MKVRQYRSEDHALLASWWTSHNWPVIQPEMLSTFGYIVETKGIPVLAGFLYETTSVIGWLEFIVGNPLYSQERKQALPVLLDHIAAQAKRRGIQALFTSSNHPGLIAGLEAKGFGISDTNVTHLIKRLS